VRWILVDVVLAGAAVALLVVVALGLWRRVKALGKAVAVATAQLEAVTAQLDTVGTRDRSFVTATPAGHLGQARQQPRGVRSRESHHSAGSHSSARSH
jgi:hypothetical protein